MGILIGLGVVLFIVHLHSSVTLQPSDSHVVFLYDDGKRQTLDTKAATVGDLVKKLPLNLIAQDVVEPAADTPIVEDNFRVNVYRARPVTVVDGTNKTVVLTAQKSARTVAQSAGLNINPEDIAKFAPGDVNDNTIGEEVIVSRATPISLNLYGAQVPSYTQAKTVAGLLQEKGIKLNKGESVSPAGTTPITPGLQIFVLNRGSQLVTTESVVPAPVQTIPDPTLSFGATAVRQAGAPGKKTDTYIITVAGGAETGRQLIQEVVVQNPVPQIVARGTSIDIDSDKQSVMRASGIASSDFAYVNYIVSHESGWCPTKWQGEHSCPAGFEPLYAVDAPLGYGLGQATPPVKMAAYGSDWQTNPITQLHWATAYANRTYGGWSGAYSHKVNTGWW